jgi:pyruvate-formate lyase
VIDILSEVSALHWQTIYSNEALRHKAEKLFKEQREFKRLDGWFLIKEIQMRYEREVGGFEPEMQAAQMVKKMAAELPLKISEHAVFAGTQNDAFARTYALINPAFNVESFSGYCDPTAVFDDITPDEAISRERIDRVRQYSASTDYVRELRRVYDRYQEETSEAVFFVEQVTGHLIPDLRPVLAGGIESIIHKIEAKIADAAAVPRKNYQAFIVALEAALVLAERYADLALKLADQAAGPRQAELRLIHQTLSKVPRRGAANLFEAIQAFIILWQVICIEQAPNPYAFSVGNADRIFEPYRAMEGCDRARTAALFKHLLVFFNVGDRSWAISQNLIVGGRSQQGTDLTYETSYALLDAYYETNFPQPILSVKLHRGTPGRLYEELGRFFFTPGCLTPSFFNDDALFPILASAGVAGEDLENYAVAGCQEPLIMGQDNGNTTNSWLNLAKILELTLNDGHSTITGKKLGPGYAELGLGHPDPLTVLQKVRPIFTRQLAYFVDRMVDAANGCSRALALLPVPFLSTQMGGVESGIDLRDVHEQGTRYNGSGCLIHGLSVVVDSFIAIDALIRERPEDAGRLLEGLRKDFQTDADLRQYLCACEKYGNNLPVADQEARRVAAEVSRLILSKRNYLGNPFRPDWSSPSTHLLYGYWVGATPDGRKAREMLGYGLDPLYGEADSGLGFRILSLKNLPFELMNGGCATHFGIDPKYFPERTMAAKGLAFYNRVVRPLFFSGEPAEAGPFYLYVNVTTPEMLRRIKDNPQKYAPGGVYIVRIHGTFVNFLDLSPAIQNDIILRLDLQSTKL